MISSLFSNSLSIESPSTSSICVDLKDDSPWRSVFFSEDDIDLKDESLCEFLKQDSTNRVLKDVDILKDADGMPAFPPNWEYDKKDADRVPSFPPNWVIDMFRSKDASSVPSLPLTGNMTIKMPMACHHYLLTGNTTCSARKINYLAISNFI